jgi:glycosyltransferase involved in cell wall biosynthesis
MFFIITEYFHPFSDAGGPIRSIENLIKVLNNRYSLKVITSANSHQGDPLPSTLKSDLFVPEPITNSDIYYSQNSARGYIAIFKLFYKNRLHPFYINGLFIPRLCFLPALICKNIIISPRGMLINDTLGKKAIFKKLYLFLLKQVISKKAVWHATDKAEVSDIKRFFGINANVQLISNIPVKPTQSTKLYTKHSGELRLVFYGLIVQKKGLLTLIQSLKSLSYRVSLDIYGAVKDQDYWKLCQQQINNNDSLASFNYKGHANPADSQTILASYDALVLLTKGENFGHSIYEALSVGTPVIISDKTPWLFEESSTPAGWVVNYANNEFDTQRLKQVLEALYNMDNNTYSLCSANAHKYAVDFYNAHDFKAQYTALFNSFN